MQKYTTILIADNKNRVTIPAKVMEKVNPEKERVVYRLSYDLFTNVITLEPIGDTNTK